MNPARKRQEKTVKTLALLEKRLPFVRRLTRSPRYGKWMPTVVAVLGACLPLLLMLVIPLIPWPQVDIPLPHVEIPVPHVDLPSIALPEAPEWLTTVMNWLQKTWPIWIALGFVYLEARERARADEKDPVA
jgi:hypothetical protein